MRVIEILMRRKLLRTILVLVLWIGLFPPGAGRAQSSPVTGPIYIVQEGDNLWDIAYRFHVSLGALENANGITDANQISIGQQLVIPGLEGIQGVLSTEIIPYGESLHSLSLRYNISEPFLKQLNHLTSPDELYAGYSLIILQSETQRTPGKRLNLEAGQSLFELSVLNNTDPWSLLAANGMKRSLAIFPGEILRTAEIGDEGPGSLPASIEQVELPQLIQGQTAQITISAKPGLRFSGTLGDWKLNFFEAGASAYTALQGIHAMAEPGLYPLTLQMQTQSGSQSDFSQMVMVQAGDFLYDRSVAVDPATLDPDTNRVENDLWSNAASGVTTEKMWAGKFYLPVDPAFAECYASRFGSRRSYNGSAYNYFHTGIDFCGQVGDPIYAAAPGTVVYTGELTVRGNATMIDHGRGVFTAYMHQSEILVNVGDHVDEGQLIGKVGNTGRVEGPHLHFEVLVGGIQVDPLEWLSGQFP